MLDLGLGIDFAGTIGTIGRYLLFAIIAAILYFAGNFVFEQGKYNKHIILRRIMSDNKKQYFSDKAKQIKTEQGIFWKFKNLKKLVAVPPDECLEMNSKGKLVANAAIDAKGQITWLKDKVDYKDYKTNNDTYEPITSETMADYARQYNYNKSLRKEGFFDKYGGQIIGGFILIMLVVVLSISWGKFTEPLLTAQENQLADHKITRDILLELKEIKTGQVNLEKEIENQKQALKELDDTAIKEVPPN